MYFVVWKDNIQWWKRSPVAPVAELPWPVPQAKLHRIQLRTFCMRAEEFGKYIHQNQRSCVLCDLAQPQWLGTQCNKKQQ